MPASLRTAFTLSSTNSSSTCHRVSTRYVCAWRISRTSVSPSTVSTACRHAGAYHSPATEIRLDSALTSPSVTLARYCRSTTGAEEPALVLRGSWNSAPVTVHWSERLSNVANRAPRFVAIQMPRYESPLPPHQIGTLCAARRYSFNRIARSTGSPPEPSRCSANNGGACSGHTCATWNPARTDGRTVSPHESSVAAAPQTVAILNSRRDEFSGVSPYGLGGTHIAEAELGTPLT